MWTALPEALPELSETSALQAFQPTRSKLGGKDTVYQNVPELTSLVPQPLHAHKSSRDRVE